MIMPSTIEVDHGEKHRETRPDRAKTNQRHSGSIPSVLLLPGPLSPPQHISLVTHLSKKKKFVHASGSRGTAHHRTVVRGHGWRKKYQATTHDVLCAPVRAMSIDTHAEVPYAVER